ncbi:MAG: glycosyltransferase family 1 protein [Patescibacteria group bacterium]
MPKQHIYVFDPTYQDNQSKVRGIGRYLQVLRECFETEFTFVSSLEAISTSKATSTFINPFFNFLRPPLLSKRICAKQIAVIHDLIPLKHASHFPVGLMGKIHIWKNKLALKQYDTIITDSHESKKDIMTILNIPERLIRVVYPALPRIFMQKPQQTAPQFVQSKIGDSPFCLYVGDATWNKNLPHIAHAVNAAQVYAIFVGKVFSTNPSVHPWNTDFHIFRRLIQNNKKVIFPGFITDQDLISLYAKAAFNILLSRDEGFGYSYIEAASQSCPSLMSTIAVFHEIAGSAACFVNPESISETISSMRKIIDSKSLQKDLGQKALDRSNLYTQDKMKTEFLQAVL